MTQTKISYCLFALWITLTSSSIARIGETEVEIEKRFGTSHEYNPKPFEDNSLPFPVTLCLRNIDTGLAIDISNKRPDSWENLKHLIRKWYFNDPFVIVGSVGSCSFFGDKTGSG